jgi:hypothetical protein
MVHIEAEERSDEHDNKAISLIGQLAINTSAPLQEAEYIMEITPLTSAA